MPLKKRNQTKPYHSFLGIDLLQLAAVLVSYLVLIGTLANIILWEKISLLLLLSF